MSEYVIDYETGNTQQEYGSQSMFNSHIKIDKYGNVNIKCQDVYQQQNAGITYYPWYEVLSINDNIPFPSYFENILKTIINNKRLPYYAGWNYIIDLIKLFKNNIKELSNNPQDVKDTKTRLEFSLNKNELLETQLTEMEQKLKNIQTAYFDTLKDNEKLKEEINRLKEKNKNIENELKNKKDTIYVNVPVENPKPISLKNAFHNPGGATIYTNSNAANRMVYNEDTEVWEPEEN
jgi:hypothetical protein